MFFLPYIQRGATFVTAHFASQEIEDLQKEGLLLKEFRLQEHILSFLEFTPQRRGTKMITGE